MATKSKTPGARGSATASAQQQAGDAVTLADDERQPCEVWTRVMGYHRPVDSFNEGKRAEHAERRFFKLPIQERAA